MKKWIGYAVILIPIAVVAFKWEVWKGGIGAVVLVLVAWFLCTVYNDVYEQRKTK